MSIDASRNLLVEAHAIHPGRSSCMDLERICVIRLAGSVGNQSRHTLGPPRPRDLFVLDLMLLEIERPLILCDYLRHCRTSVLENMMIGPIGTAIRRASERHTQEIHNAVISDPSGWQNAGLGVIRGSGGSSA